MPLSNLTIVPRSSPNYTPDRPGDWPDGPVAFVLQTVPYYSLEEYDVAVQSALPRAYNTLIPKSLHYLIDQVGNIHQYVDYANTAWGIDELDNPTWPGIVTYDANFSTEINAAFVHIGFCNALSPSPEAVLAAAKIIAGLCAVYNIVVSVDTIITASTLDETRPPYDLVALPTNLLAFAQAQLLLAQPSPDVDALTQLVQDLSDGLQTAQQDIMNLQGSVTFMQSYGVDIADLQNAVSGLAADATAADFPKMRQDLDDAMEAIIALQATVASQQVCIDSVCPPEGSGTTINYQLSAGSAAILTPGADVRLNLAIQIDDTEPASVTIGPLWNAHVEKAGTWNISAAFSCPALEWTVGKKVWLDLITSNGNTRIAEWTAPSGGVHSASASGTSVRVVPPTTDMYLRAGTDEVLAPVARTITYAALTMEVA